MGALGAEVGGTPGGEVRVGAGQAARVLGGRGVQGGRASPGGTLWQHLRFCRWGVIASCYLQMLVPAHRTAAAPPPGLP